MPHLSENGYEAMDRPEIISLMFHPRPRTSSVPPRGQAEELLIEAQDGVYLSASLHMKGADLPTILFFHGNGEIASDYDEMGPLYNRMDINFIVFDYRGYGLSSGFPSPSSMMSDCHSLFDYTLNRLVETGFSGPLVLMGRSLGSASAIELASGHAERIQGLVVESGFASTGRLLEVLGINTEAMGFKEEMGFGNIDKIRLFSGPTLIIHAEKDHLIPFSEGKALFEASVSEKKRLLVIPEANHNNIFLYGLAEYMTAIKELTLQI